MKKDLYKKAIEYGLQGQFDRLLSVEGKEFTYPGQAHRQTGLSYIMGHNSSTKTLKNLAFNYTSGVLYLSASDNSGVNICPKATSGCKAACLYFTGRNAMRSKGELISRNNASQFLKTVLFFINRPYFMDWLQADIEALIRRKKAEQKICVRLNGTSDINIKTFKNSKGELLIEKYPQVQFYDYTKVYSYLENEKKFPNYDLTFSYGGTENLEETLRVLAEGYRIAVPFDKKSFGGHFPETFFGRPVVDGDENDLTFLQAKDVIYGLKVKTPLKSKEGYEKFVKENDFFIKMI